MKYEKKVSGPNLMTNIPGRQTLNPNEIFFSFIIKHPIILIDDFY